MAYYPVEVDIDELKPGDHILVKTRATYGIVVDHHGIAVKGKKVLKVISFTSNKQNPKGVVVCQDIGTFSDGGVLYRAEYPASAELRAEMVVYRAQRLLNHRHENEEYHYFINNCEHFATFCKTGKKFSTQATVPGVAYTLGQTAMNYVTPYRA